MEINELYPIEKYYMTKNKCYKANKRRKPTGIQVHSVGSKGTTRDRWRRWNSPDYKKCANAFVDTAGIMQCLDWDVRPWLSGSGNKGNANDWCVGFEICEPSKSKDTPEVAAYLYNCVLWLCTQLCIDYNIHPANIKTHCELHREGCASNHADVNHWWGKKGTSWEQYTMDRLRQDVAAALKERGILKEDSAAFSLIDEAKQITVRKGSSGAAVTTLQMALNALGFQCGLADGIFGKKTLAAVKGFQKKFGLKVDGIVGKQTWGAIQEQSKTEVA